MTDYSELVKALRDECSYGHYACAGDCNVIEAADAIEALVKENTQLNNETINAQDTIYQQSVENTRLREALGHLLNAVKYKGMTDKFGDGCKIYEARVPEGFVIEAEAALKEPTP